MSELLVKLTDNRNLNDPVADIEGCWKRGDPVIMKPDGWQWGSGEGPPDFTVIKFEGYRTEAVRRYQWAQEEPREIVIALPKSLVLSGRHPETIIGIDGEFIGTYAHGTELMSLCRVLRPYTTRRAAWTINLDQLSPSLRILAEQGTLRVGRRVLPRDGVPADDCEWDTLAAVLRNKETQVSELEAGVTDTDMRQR